MVDDPDEAVVEGHVALGLLTEPVLEHHGTARLRGAVAGTPPVHDRAVVQEVGRVPRRGWCGHRTDLMGTTRAASTAQTMMAPMKFVDPGPSAARSEPDR